MTTPPPDKQPAAETLDGAGIVNRWRGINVKISRYLYQSPAAVAQLCEMIDEALRNERESTWKEAHDALDSMEVVITRFQSKSADMNGWYSAIKQAQKVFTEAVRKGKWLR